MRSFPAPWRIVEMPESLRVEDAKGFALAYLYFEDEPTRRGIMNRMTKEEAYAVAKAFVIMPSLREPIREVFRALDSNDATPS